MTVSSDRGGSFTATYLIVNSNSSARTVYLGLSLEGPTTINNPGNDVGCSVPANSTSYGCSRSFVIPSAAATGTYNAVFAIWSGTPGSSTRYGSTQTGSGWITVTPPSADPVFVSASISPYPVTVSSDRGGAYSRVAWACRVQPVRQVRPAKECLITLSERPD